MLLSKRLAVSHARFPFATRLHLDGAKCRLYINCGSVRLFDVTRVPRVIYILSYLNSFTAIPIGLDDPIEGQV